jgi:pimeloyl-ACP methyl ester carboxylesterase
VVAHRGTEFGREFVRDGVVADGGMVAARTNAQMADAIELTERALDLAKKPHNLSEYGHTPEVTVTGHSLGGVLAQITAYKFGLRGETFNAFGAVSLGYKIPEGGAQVVNHVKASDPVSAASRHFGQVRYYASAQDVRTVGALGGYDNDRDAQDARLPGLAMILSVDAHRMHHFTNLDSRRQSRPLHPGRPRGAAPGAAIPPHVRQVPNDLDAAREAPRSPPPPRSKCMAGRAKHRAGWPAPPWTCRAMRSATRPRPAPCLARGQPGGRRGGGPWDCIRPVRRPAGVRQAAGHYRGERGPGAGPVPAAGQCHRRRCAAVGVAPAARRAAVAG